MNKILPLRQIKHGVQPNSVRSDTKQNRAISQSEDSEQNRSESGKMDCVVCYEQFVKSKLKNVRCCGSDKKTNMWICGDCELHNMEHGIGCMICRKPTSQFLILDLYFEEMNEEQICIIKFNKIVLFVVCVFISSMVFMDKIANS